MVKSILKKWQNYMEFMQKESAEWDKYESSINKDITKTEVTPPEVKVAKHNSSISKKNLKVLLHIKELLRRREIYIEDRRRALDIKKVNKEEFLIKDNSLESLLIKTLSRTDKPVHINNIITQVEKLGWQSSSPYHKYSHIHRVLCENSYMFTRMGNGNFRLNDGFRKSKSVKRVNIIRKSDPINRIATIQDVVIDTVVRYGDKTGISPAEVVKIITTIGYKEDYKSIFNILQSPHFVNKSGKYFIKK